MPKRYALCGLANPIVDLLVNVEDDFLARANLEKAGSRLVSPAAQQELLGQLQTKDLQRVSGGSVSNSIVAFSQLGGKSALIGCVGDDELGRFYIRECEELGVRFVVPPIPGASTGSSLVLITPDAERTMQTSLGISGALSSQLVDETVFPDVEWLFLEGYVFANPEYGQGAIRTAIQAAVKENCRIAVTFSESWVVQHFKEPLEEAVQRSSLVFANEQEARVFTGTESLDDAYAGMKQRGIDFVLTAGEKGARGWIQGEDILAHAIPCKPVDLTGAGDVLAAGFLYGMTHGYTAEESLRRACFLASKVIGKIGARLEGDVRALWDSAQ